MRKDATMEMLLAIHVLPIAVGLLVMMICALVKLGASPNTRGAKNKTALMYAAESGNKAVVEATKIYGAF